MAQEALRFSFEGNRGVRRPKGLDWCGNVKSITEQVQHTLILPGDRTGEGSAPILRGVAPRRSPARRRT
jgi:hypothetical protein